jgi:hypothetical protein
MLPIEKIKRTFSSRWTPIGSPDKFSNTADKNLYDTYINSNAKEVFADFESFKEDFYNDRQKWNQEYATFHGISSDSNTVNRHLGLTVKDDSEKTSQETKNPYTWNRFFKDVYNVNDIVIAPFNPLSYFGALDAVFTGRNIWQTSKEYRGSAVTNLARGLNTIITSPGITESQFRTPDPSIMPDPEFNHGMIWQKPTEEEYKAWQKYNSPEEKKKQFKTEIESYIKLDNTLKATWDEWGIRSKNPSFMQEATDMVVYTGMLLGTRMIPVVGLPLAIILGMQMEGIDASAEAYKNLKEKGVPEDKALDIAQEFYQVMGMVGSTEMMGIPSTGAGILKKGILTNVKTSMFEGILKKYGIKLAEKDIKDITQKLINRTALKQAGKSFGIQQIEEVGQESFTDIVGQNMNIKYDIQNAFDYNRLLHTMLITATSTGMLGGVTSKVDYNTTKKTLETIKSNFNKIDEQVGKKIITQEEANVFKEKINTALSSAENTEKFVNEFNTASEEVSKEIQERINYVSNEVQATNEHLKTIITGQEFDNDKLKVIDEEHKKRYFNAKTEEEKQAIVNERFEKGKEALVDITERDENVVQDRVIQKLSQLGEVGYVLNDLSKLILRLEARVNRFKFFNTVEDAIKSNNLFENILSKVESTDEFVEAQSKIKDILTPNIKEKRIENSKRREEKYKNVKNEEQKKIIEQEYQAEEERLNQLELKPVPENEIKTLTHQSLLYGNDKIGIEPKPELYIEPITSIDSFRYMEEQQEELTDEQEENIANLSALNPETEMYESKGIPAWKHSDSELNTKIMKYHDKPVINNYHLSQLIKEANRRKSMAHYTQGVGKKGEQDVVKIIKTESPDLTLDLYSQQATRSQVEYLLKAVSILQSDKAKQMFEKGKKNNWSLDKILTELAIPKEQKRLLLESGIQDREQLAIDFASKYAFTVEMNVAMDSFKDYTEVINPITNEVDIIPFEPDVDEEFIEDEEGNVIDVRTVLTEKGKKELEEREKAILPTQYYQSMSAKNDKNQSKYENNPDWQYNEVQINTPLIEPSIIGHAIPFDNANGIGWVRVWKNEKTGEVEIQEIQSDLFQRGRDKRKLVSDKWSPDKKYILDKNYHYKEIGFDFKNEFLQLLNRNNNWITFFTKAIIQRYAKEGYSVIRFPKGETAARIEGHQTIADEINKIDAKIEAWKQKGEIEYSVFSYDDIVATFSTKEEAQVFIEMNNENYDEQLHLGSTPETIEELEQKKQHLKTQGIEKLKPVEAFYEKTMGNILEKQFGKENVKTVKDEFGNEWRELDIKGKNIEIFLQKAPKKAKGVQSINQAEKVSQNVSNEAIKQSTPKFEEEKTSGYRNRTIKNASADATIAIAVDFNSAGEKLTKSSVLNQKKKYIPIDANNLEVTPERVDKIVDELNSVNANTLNIAGNGLYTMKGKYTQKQVDDFTYELLNQVLNSPNLKTKIESIRSGGQTGFDEAGIKAGIRLGLPTIILAPKGWTFRDVNGKDISNEQQFKARFNIIPAKTSNSVIEQSKSLYLTKDQLMQEFEANQAIGSLSRELVEFISEKHPDIKYRIVNNDFTFIANGNTYAIQGRVGYMLKNRNTGETIIYMNQDMTGGINQDLYDNLAHELIHVELNEAIDQNPALAKELRGLFKEVKRKVLEDENFYINNKEQLDFIFNESSKDNRDIKEFVAYVESNTSPLRGFMRDTHLGTGTSLLKRYYQLIKAFIYKAFGKNDKPTLLNALDFIITKYSADFPTMTEVKYQVEATESNRNMEHSETYDALEKVFSLSEELLQDLRAVQAFEDLLKEEWGIINLHKYIASGITKDYFLNRLKNTPKFINKASIYYSKYIAPQHSDITLDDYINSLVTYIYNLSSNSTDRTVVIINPSTGEVFEHDYNYKDIKGVTRTVRKPKTLMDEALPILENIFNAKLEIVYIDAFRTTEEYEYKETNQTETIIKDMAPLDYIHSRNRSNSTVKADLRKIGIIFPGTWSDKNTVVAFKILDGKFDKEIITEFESLYREKLGALIQEGVVPEETIKDLERAIHPSDIIRLVLEDIRLGGRFIETDKGKQWESALFIPDNPSTYDAIKIFKRPYLVAPMFRLNEENSSDIATKIIENIYDGNQKESGINITPEGITLNVLVFDSKSDDPYIFEYEGIEYNMNEILNNAFKTETTDGSFIFETGGFDQVWRELAGTLKQGAIKLWGHNNIQGTFNQPFFLKTAGHGFSKNDLIIQWMRKNNLALLISDTSTKINYVGKGKLQEDIESGIFQLPLRNLQRIMEKDDHQTMAKGLKQALTSNMFVPNNPILKKADEEGRVLNIFKNLIDNLIDNYENRALSLDGYSMLEYIKEICVNPTNNRERAISDLLMDMLYTEADRVLQQQKEDNPQLTQLANQVSELINNPLTNKVVANENLANQFGNIFFHPYFKTIFESHMNRIMSDLLFYKMPSAYSVISPDLGILATTRYKKVTNYIHSIVSSNKKKEIRELEKERTRIVNEKDKADRDIQYHINKLAELEKDTEEYNKEQEYVDTYNILNRELEKNIKKLDTNLEKLNSTEYADKEFNRIKDIVLDPKTGRLNKNYTMITEDIAKRFDIQLGDNIITSAMPSDSMQSMDSPIVVAILNKEQSLINCLVCNSEYIQSQIGKDFDLDTLLVLPFSKYFNSKEDYIYLGKVLRKVRQGYIDFIAKEYSRKLGRTLTEQDIYKKSVRLEYLQKVYGTVDNKDLYNPLTDQAILDKYKKLIGNVINRRTLVTLKTGLGFKTKHSFKFKDRIFEWNIDFTKVSAEAHVAHLGETNAQVDIPSDDTALHYNSIDPLRQFFVDNNLEDARKDLMSYYYTLKGEDKSKFINTLKTQIKLIASTDKALFQMLYNISDDRNILYEDEDRSLQENIQYIEAQKEIMNQLIDPELKETLPSKLNIPYNFPYFENIELTNDINDFLPMYLINNINTTLFPEYRNLNSLKTINNAIFYAEKTIPELVLQSYNVRNDMAYSSMLDSLSPSDKFIKEHFLYTHSNRDLHILKGMLLRVVNSFGIVHATAKEGDLMFFNGNLSIPVDNLIFDRIMKKLFEVPSLVINQEFMDKDMGITVAGLGIHFTKNKVVFSITSNGKKYSMNHFDILIENEKGNPIAKAFHKRLFGEESIFKNSTVRHHFTKGVNTLFSMNMDKRMQLAKELINENYYQLSNEDKLLLWSSLSPAVEKGNTLEKETLSNNNSNNRFLALMQLVNDDVTKRYTKVFFREFNNNVEHGFNSVLKVNRIFGEDESADFEIYSQMGVSNSGKTLNQEALDLASQVREGNYTPLPDDYMYLTFSLEGTGYSDTKRISNLVTPVSLEGKIKVNDIDAYNVGARTIISQIERVITDYKLTSFRISQAMNDYIKSSTFNKIDMTKHIKLIQLREKIFNEVENNPYKIQILPDLNGYSYKAIVNDTIIEASSMDELNDKLGLKGKEAVFNKIAMEYHRLYSVFNMDIVDSVIGYLESMNGELNSYSQKVMLKGLINKYKRQRIAMENRRWRYMPHIIPERVYKTVVVNFLKTKEIGKIRKSIAEARKYIAENTIIPKAYTDLDNMSEEDIIKLAIENVEKKAGRYGIGGMGQYIDTSMLPRDLTDDLKEIDGIGLLEKGNVIHTIHANRFVKNIKNDLLFANHLYFEDQFLRRNPHDKHFMQNMMNHTATLSGNRMLASKEIDVDEISSGMELSFFYPNQKRLKSKNYDISKTFITGVVAKVDNKYVYMKMDRKKFEAYLNEQINRYSEVNRQIQSNPFQFDTVPPTSAQIALLVDMKHQGYLNDSMETPRTISEASQIILDTLKSVLDNKAIWGRFRKDQIHRRNFKGEDAQSVLTKGAYRYMPNVFGNNLNSVINYMDGLARELDNRYDKKLSEEGWSNFVASERIFPFLKYQMLEAIPNLMSGLRKVQAVVGLSTPAGGIHNYIQGITAIIRDAGMKNFIVTAKEVKMASNIVKIAKETSDIPRYIQIANNAMQNIDKQYNDSEKVDIIVGLAFKNMLETGVLFEDFLVNNVIGNTTEIEDNVIKYRNKEKWFTLRKKLVDSVGYKEYREKSEKLYKDMFQATTIREINRIYKQILAEKKVWENRKIQIGEGNVDIFADKLTKEELDIVKNFNLAEYENKRKKDVVMEAGTEFFHHPFFGYLLGTQFFKKAEGHLRRNATIYYILNEFNKENFDENSIFINTVKGISRTQAMYEQIDRRLGDRSNTGKFLYMFGQYPMYTLEIYKRMFRQMKETDNAKDVEVIKKKMKKEFAVDTMFAGANSLLQGLKLGHPVNIVIWNAVVFAVNAVINALGGDDEDKNKSFWQKLMEDYETKDFLFSLIAFKFGMGHTLILNSLYNFVLGKFQNVENKKNEREAYLTGKEPPKPYKPPIFSMGRMGNTFQLGERGMNIVYENITGNKEPVNIWQDKKDLHAGMRYLLPFDPIAPIGYKKADLDYYLFTKKPIMERAVQMLELGIPVYPILKYQTDLPLPGTTTKEEYDKILEERRRR